MVVKLRESQFLEKFDSPALFIPSVVDVMVIEEIDYQLIIFRRK
jgi:hypothetical protein